MLAVFEATPSSKSDLQSLLGPQDIPALPDYMADEEPLPTSVHGIVTGPEEEVEEVQAEQHAPAKPAQPHQPTGTLYEMAAKICTVDDLLHFNDAWKMQNRLNVSSYQANPTPETQSTVEANLWFQLKTMERLMLQDMNLVQGMMRHKYSEQGYQDDLWEKIARHFVAKLPSAAVLQISKAHSHLVATIAEGRRVRLDVSAELARLTFPSVLEAGGLIGVAAASLQMRRAVMEVQAASARDTVAAGGVSEALIINFGPLNYATMGAKSGRNFPDTLEIARHMVEVYDQENAACSDLV
ncbi:hypothetical protein APUTEX25_000137 [Auxenochlorella protothecoides]|nr:hypothetical protein APUTEX25_000137 [Auxenochlorella protothecoides]|eukprot:RMZ55554.1 hypothetical protein APUTEX25_000137 [Auxenochlorella protothecoides]